MNAASRRTLERDVAALVAAHGIYAVLHALVESCHSMINQATDPQSKDRMAWLCGRLRTAEHTAHQIQILLTSDVKDSPDSIS